MIPLAAAAISAAANIGGGILSRNAARKEATLDRKYQKEFAQHGVRWKVEDAKAAGIHPLAALGAQTVSYQPVGVGSSGHLGTGVASAGQDIARAMHATRSAGERVDAYTKTIQDLNIRRMGLENDLLTSQIAKINQTANPPAMPLPTDEYLIEGQGNSPVIDKNMDRVGPPLGNPSIEPGAIVDTGFARTPTGHAPVMSKDVKDRLEEDWMGSLLWNVRNRLAPTFMPSKVNPPNVRLKSHQMWVYDPMAQEYRVVTKPPRDYPRPRRPYTGSPDWFRYHYP